MLKGDPGRLWPQECNYTAVLAEARPLWIDFAPPRSVKACRIVIKHSVLIKLMNCAAKLRYIGSALLGICLSGSLAICLGHLRSWLNLDVRDVLIGLFVFVF